MPNDRTLQDPDDRSVSPDIAADEARENIMAALRAARSAAIRAGADPDAMTATLAERLRKVREMLADEAEPTPGD